MSTKVTHLNKQSNMVAAQKLQESPLSADNDTIQDSPLSVTPLRHTPSGIPQTKLTIGAPDDAYEREADSVADQVVQRMASGDDSPPPPLAKVHGITSLQRKCSDCEQEEHIQRKGMEGVGNLTASSNVSQQISVARGSGNAMQGNVLQQMQQGFGRDFSQVRIHTGPQAGEMSRALQARAFTVGNDIFFNRGEYQPETERGKHLLAHELVHTVQQGGAGRIMRAPDLTLPEIDPSSQAPLDTNDTYQWENKALLDTVFNDPKSEGNDRLLALRSFLLLQKELELNAKVPHLSESLTPEKLQEALDEQISSVEGEITIAEKAEAEAAAAQADAKNNQPAAKLAKEAAKKALDALLKTDPRAKELHSLRAEVKKKQEKAQEELAKVDRNIAWLKHKGNYTTEPGAPVSKEQAGWDKRRANAQKVIDDEQKRVTDTDAEYDKLVGPLQRDLISKTEALENLKREEKESKARKDAAGKLAKDLKSLLATIRKAKDGDPNALRNFKLKSFQRELDDMNHGQLMDAIVVLFDQDDQKAATDPTYVKRFPDWQRYAVIHYSGMRYRNAHGSWFDPTKILKHLRTQELAAKSPEQRRMMQAEAAKTADNDTLKAEKINAKTRKALAEVQPEAVRKSLKGDDRDYYDEVLAVESSLNAILLELQDSGSDPTRAAELRVKISALDKDMETVLAKFSDKGRDAVKKAMAKKTIALQQIAEERAINKVKALSSGQAFGVLKVMHDRGQIPEVVWRELLAFTEGRVNTEDQAWEVNLKLKDAKGTTPEEEASVRVWETVLKDSGFYSNATGWREQHSKTLAPTIVGSMVCDQLGSQLQHLRGHKRSGGLRNNALYYKDLESAGVAGAYFKNPTSVSDLKVGASIFWFDWTENAITEEYAKLWEKQKKQKYALTTHQKQRDEQRAIMDARNPRDATKFKYGQSARDAAQKKWSKLNDQIIEDEAKLSDMDIQEKGMKVWAPEKDKLPDISHIVSPTINGKDISVGNLRFKDNFIDSEGWMYRALDQVIPVTKDATRNAKVLMRVKPNPFFKDRKIDDSDFSFRTDEKVLKQWMGWTHEATVMYADESNTMTFDTSGKYQDKDIKGMTARMRKTSEIVGNKNVFVGYSPDANPPGFTTPYTKLNSSSMSSEAYEMTDKK